MSHHVDRRIGELGGLTMVGATMPGRVWNTRARPRRHAIPMQAFDNLLAKSESVVVAREDMKRSLPLSENAKQLIAHSRQTIRNILGDADHRLFVVVGPCSIHDIEAALEYTRRLKELADKLSDTFYLVMRVYFEKPRTTAGWKGLINDPDLDGVQIPNFITCCHAVIAVTQRPHKALRAPVQAPV